MPREVRDWKKTPQQAKRVRNWVKVTGEKAVSVGKESSGIGKGEKSASSAREGGESGLQKKT